MDLGGGDRRPCDRCLVPHPLTERRRSLLVATTAQRCDPRPHTTRWCRPRARTPSLGPLSAGGHRRAQPRQRRRVRHRHQPLARVPPGAPPPRSRIVQGDSDRPRRRQRPHPTLAAGCRLAGDAPEYPAVARHRSRHGRFATRARATAAGPIRRRVRSKVRRGRVPGRPAGAHRFRRKVRVPMVVPQPVDPFAADFHGPERVVAIRRRAVDEPVLPGALGCLRRPGRGPVAPVFGEWVRDVPLGHGVAPWRRWSLLSHTSYWRPGRRREVAPASDDEHRQPDHLDHLRRSIRLDSLRRLHEEAIKHDPLMYCRTRDSTK